METTSSFLCTIRAELCHYVFGILNHKTVREWNLQHCHILEIMLRNIYFSIRDKTHHEKHETEYIRWALFRGLKICSILQNIAIRIIMAIILIMVKRPVQTSLRIIYSFMQNTESHTKSLLKPSTQTGCSITYYQANLWHSISFVRYARCYANHPKP